MAFLATSPPPPLFVGVLGLEGFGMHASKVMRIWGWRVHERQWNTPEYPHPES